MVDWRRQIDSEEMAEVIAPYSPALEMRFAEIVARARAEPQMGQKGPGKKGPAPASKGKGKQFDARANEKQNKKAQAEGAKIGHLILTPALALALTLTLTDISTFYSPTTLPITRLQPSIPTTVNVSTRRALDARHRSTSSDSSTRTRACPGVVILSSAMLDWVPRAALLTLNSDTSTLESARATGARQHARWSRSRRARQPAVAAAPPQSQVPARL